MNTLAKDMKWQNLLSSQDSLHYRLEIEHKGLFLDFGINKQKKRFGFIVMRFEKSTSSGKTMLLSKKVELAKDDINTILDEAADLRLDNLRWVDYNRNSMTIKKQASLYQGKFEYTDQKTYVLMINPAAVGDNAFEAEEGGTIFKLKIFSRKMYDALYPIYADKINQVIEQAKKEGYIFLEPISSLFD